MQERARVYRLEHFDKISEYNKRWRLEHHPEHLDNSKTWRAGHVNQVRVYNAMYHITHIEQSHRRNKEWRLANPERWRENSRRWREAHPEVVILRKIVSFMLKRSGISKMSRSYQYVGCTPQFLRLHLEAQFKKGMTWENRGTVWEVDHRIPLDWFNLRECSENLFIASHWTNLQPMFKGLNRLKSARYVA
jgi:hypothetical protein